MQRCRGNKWLDGCLLSVPFLGSSFMKVTIGSSQTARVSGSGSDCTPLTQFVFYFLFFETAYSHMTTSKWSSAAMRSQLLLWGLQKQKAKTKGCRAASKRGRRGINEGGSSTYAGQAGGGDGRLARGAVAVFFDLGGLGWVFGLAGEASVGHVGDCLSHPDSMRRGNRRLRCG